MGLKINALLIDPDEPILGKGHSSSQDIQKYKIRRSTNLSPKWLNIGFYRNRIIILNEDIVQYVLSGEEKLHYIEQSLVTRYPNSGITHIHQFDTISFVGYCYIADGIKQRTKAVAEGKLYLDQGTILELESPYLMEVVNYLKAKNPKYFENTLRNFEKLGKSEMIKQFLMLREEVFVNEEMGYLNGGIDEEILHKFVHAFLDSDWSKLEKLEYVEYPNVSTKDKNLDVLKYIYHAYCQLNGKTDNTVRSHHPA